MCGFDGRILQTSHYGKGPSSVSRDPIDFPVWRILSAARHCTVLFYTLRVSIGVGGLQVELAESEPRVETHQRTTGSVVFLAAEAT